MAEGSARRDRRFVCDPSGVAAGITSGASGRSVPVPRIAFLAGYGAAQAIPGPLFTFAAYLGAAMGPEPHGLIGAALALWPCSCPGS